MEWKQAVAVTQTAAEMLHTTPVSDLQALYVMGNVATESEEDNERVMVTHSPSVLERFLADESSSQMRVAAVW